MNQLSQDDEAAFLESLGMTDDQSEVLLNEANDYEEDDQEFQEPEPPALQELAAPAEPVVDAFAQRMEQLERTFNERLDKLTEKFAAPQQAQPQQYQQPQYQQPMQPTRYATDLDMHQLAQRSEAVLQQQAAQMHHLMVSGEAQRLNAVKAELRAQHPDIFNYVAEEKIDAAFQHAMQNRLFNVPWIDQIATVYWKAKGPELSKAQAAQNELATKRAEKQKQAQKAIPAGGASYQQPVAARATGNGRGFKQASAGFMSALNG